MLGLWDKGGRLGVMTIQKTHCGSDAELCQSVTDMRVRMHVIHSPAVDGDVRAGVLLVLTHDWEVIESVVGSTCPYPDRVLCLSRGCECI